MVSAMTSPDNATTVINYSRQSGDRRDSSVVCPDSDGQDVGKSDQLKQTHTCNAKLGARRTSQIVPQQVSTAPVEGSWSDSAVTSNHSASQISDNQTAIL